MLMVLTTSWFVVLTSTILLQYSIGAQGFQQAFASGQALRTPPVTVPSHPGRSYPDDTAVVQPAHQPVTPGPRLAPGALVKGYRVRALLGMGGFASVYLAERCRTRHRVALKVFAQRKAWNYERRMLASVTHPAFPRLLGAFRLHQSYVLVQEYVPGIDLDQYLSERGSLPIWEVLELGSQLVEALAYLHGRKHPIIHRDLKPANVQLMPNGRARLLDLGIAQRVKHSSLFAGWGTRQYMAPEALAQQPCPASDIYSLGVLLWEALAGQLPCPIAGIYPALPAWELPGLSVLLRSMVAFDAAGRPSASTVLVELSWLSCLAEARAAA